MKRIEMLKIMNQPISCKKGCGDCCGIVPFAKEEKDAIPSELKKGVFFDQMGNQFLPRPKERLICPFLKNDDGGNKRCGIYEYRPIICKAFGRLEKLQCPHGANSKKLIKDKHFRKFLELSNYPKKLPEPSPSEILAQTGELPVFLNIINKIGADGSI